MHLIRMLKTYHVPTSSLLKFFRLPLASVAALSFTVFCFFHPSAAAAAPEGFVHVSQQTISSGVKVTTTDRTRYSQAFNATPRNKSFAGEPSQATINFVKSVDEGNFQLAELLLRSGADINCNNCNSNGKSPLHSTYRATSEHHPNRRLVWLLDNGADPNIQDYSGQTLLMSLAVDPVINPFWSGIDDFEYLIRRGANPRLKDNQGNTVLHYLSKNAPSDAYEMSRSGYGDAAFSMSKQWIRAFELVMQNGADINSANTNGDTPILYLSERCHPFLIETFLRNGANPNVTNKIGLTPLQASINKAATATRPACNRVVEILGSINSAR